MTGATKHLRPDPVRALTNMIVVFSATVMLAAVWFIRWVNLGQWPDTLRLAVVTLTSAFCFGFVVFRRNDGFIPRLPAGATMSISILYLAGVIIGFLLLTVLMTWAIIRGPNLS